MKIWEIYDDKNQYLGYHVTEEKAAKHLIRLSRLRSTEGYTVKTVRVTRKEFGEYMEKKLRRSP